MEWAEILHGPSEFLAQTNADKVTFFALETVPDFAFYLPLSVFDADHCALGKSAFDLDTHARRRDILEHGDTELVPFFAIFPPDVDDVGAPETNLSAPFRERRLLRTVFSLIHCGSQLSQVSNHFLVYQIGLSGD